MAVIIGVSLGKQTKTVSGADIFTVNLSERYVELSFQVNSISPGKAICDMLSIRWSVLDVKRAKRLFYQSSYTLLYTCQNKRILLD
jgi:hypothetical protein